MITTVQFYKTNIILFCSTFYLTMQSLLKVAFYDVIIFID